MSDQKRPAHLHRCMRCGEMFNCASPGECQAGENVMPTIITAGTDGQPVFTDHCPKQPDWNWIRAYVKRMGGQDPFPRRDDMRGL